MKTNKLTKEQLLSKAVSIGFNVYGDNWIDYFIISFDLLGIGNNNGLIFKSKDEALVALEILKNNKDVFSIKGQHNCIMECNVEDIHNLITNYQVSSDWLNSQRLSNEAIA